MTTESDTVTASAPSALTTYDFDTLDTILDDLRTRDDETPQWEFCEGFMVAVACCRRPIAEAEYMPVVLGMDLPQGDAVPALFADGDQYRQFMALWQRRLGEVCSALAQPVESLDDERGYQPEVMDLRGAIAALPSEQRAEMGDAPVPSFGQIWAIGFMYAVESWPEEWAAPRDREAAKAIDAALQCILTLTEDDTAPPTLSAFDDSSPPGMSQQRLDEFVDALWAVYDLHEIWHAIGLRVEAVRVGDKTGRNDPCPCGSGKKFKKCCGA